MEDYSTYQRKSEKRFVLIQKCKAKLWEERVKRARTNQDERFRKAMRFIFAGQESW